MGFLVTSQEPWHAIMASSTPYSIQLFNNDAQLFHITYLFKLIKYNSALTAGGVFKAAFTEEMLSYLLCSLAVLMKPSWIFKINVSTQFAFQKDEFQHQGHLMPLKIYNLVYYAHFNPLKLTLTKGHAKIVTLNFRTHR